MIPIVLTGCATYQGVHVDQMTAHYSESSRNVTVLAEPFTADDAERYLGNRVFQKEYVPILIDISNQSKECYTISQEAVKQRLVPFEEVVRKGRTSTAGRACGYIGGTLAAAYLVPVGFALFALGINSHIPMFFGFVAGTSALVGGTVGGILDVSKASNINRMRYEDFQRIALKNEVIVPGSRIRRVAFIRRVDYDKKLDLRLFNEKEQKPLDFSFRF